MSESDLFSRRNFLKKTAAVGAAIAIEGIARPSRAAKPDKTESNERVGDFEKSYSYYKNIKEFAKTAEDTYGNYYERALTEQTLVREQFLSSPLREQLPEMIAFILKTKNDALLDDLYKKLAEINCQGLLYATLNKEGKYGSTKLCIAQPQLLFSHYAARTSDFLPSGKDIENDEIDPRFGQKDELITRNINEKPAWTSPRYLYFFRKLIDDPAIRKQLQAADITLAEAYSTIKAVVANLEKNIPTSDDSAQQLSVETVTKLILEERELFSRRMILDKNTKNLICLNGFDASPNGPKFDASAMNEVAAAAGVPQKNNKQIEGGDQEKSFEKIKEEMHQTIAQSNGKTLVYFNTHGSPLTLEVRRDASFASKPQNFSIDDIVDALFARIENTGDTNSLKDVTLVLDSCFSYDFAYNVIKKMRFNYDIGDTDGPSYQEKIGVMFGELTMPTIICASQKGSFTWDRSSINQILHQFKEGIKKDGGLIGERLLSSAQPVMYHNNDLTVLMGRKGGVLEIAVRGTVPKTEKTA